MAAVEIIEATSVHSSVVASQVKSLLLELKAEIDHSQMDFSEIANRLISNRKIIAFLAMHEEEPIGVLTLHECAAIYAGGLFGEISEIYVKPEYRSRSIGQLLIAAAIRKAKELNWKRLEVGSPPEEENPWAIKFYHANGFKVIGERLGRIV